MCKPNPFPRCANHARKELEAAKRNGDPKEIAKAQHAYDITPAGSKALQAAGQTSKAQHCQAEWKALNNTALKVRIQIVKAEPSYEVLFKAFDNRDEPHQVKVVIAKRLTTEHPFYNNFTVKELFNATGKKPLTRGNDA